MKSMRTWLAGFLRQDSGLEPVQYAMVLALIVIVVIAGVKLIGVVANNQNNATSNMLQNASTPSGGS